MSFLNRFKFSALAAILLVAVFVSCENEITTIGEGVIGAEPFVSSREVFDVAAVNVAIEAVQTNQSPVYQLGVFNDVVYGRTEASITSQLQLSVANPTFGNFSQQDEESSSQFTVSENETVTEVFLYIPFFNDLTDTDNDGVPDDLDDDPLDPTNDNDGDNVSNQDENITGTNPLAADTDGDGINDDVDEETLERRFPESFVLDSIFGKEDFLGTALDFKVERSTFFLRDLDPNTGFQESQEFFSTQQFSPAFTDEVLFDGDITISNEQILFEVLVDNPDTEENEIGTISRTLDPGIRVPLDIDFFQQNIINNEGSSELLSAVNFREFFRGIHMSLTAGTTVDELLLLLDITNANIEITYEFDLLESAEREEQIFTLNLITGNSGTGIVGNAVNTFVNEEYPQEILSRFGENVIPDRLHLKGGAGAYAEIELFNEGDIAELQARNLIINEANLVFHVDREGLAGDFEEPPRLYLFNAETINPLYNILTENSIADTPLGVFQNYDGILDDSDPTDLKYRVRITEHINSIVVRDSTNVKLGVMVSPDIRVVASLNTRLPNGIETDLPAFPTLTPFGTVLHSGTSEVEAKRLQLEIFFTEFD